MMVAQSEQEGLEAVGLAIGFREGLGVADRAAGAIGGVEAGIGLRDEHDGGGVARPGFFKGLLHPQDVRLVAGCELGRRGRGVAEIVAGTLNVQGCVGDATEGPAAIFDARHVAAYAKTKRSGLHLLMDAVLSQRERSAEEERTLVVETLERGESAVRRAVAVRPVVVAWRKDGRSL